MTVPRCCNALLKSATPVHGAWGSGKLLHTSLVSVLMTSDGHVRRRGHPGVLNAAAGQAPRPPRRHLTTAISSSGLTKRFRSGQLAVDQLDMLVPQRQRCTASSARTGPARPPRSGCCSAWPSPQGSRSAARRADARGQAGCCPGSGPWSRGPRSTRCCPAGTTWPGTTRPTGPPTRRTAKERITEALDRVGLLAAAKKQYRAYSLGMKQRLAIAASLLRRVS